MSKETDEQQKNTNAHKAPDSRVADAEDETDSTAAKKASKSSLKKEEQKAAHAASDTAGFGTAEAGLTALAAQFHAWKPLITRETDKKLGLGSAGPSNEFLITTLQKAESMAWQVHQLIEQSDSAMKSKLGKLVQQAMGAYDTLEGTFNGANAWISEHGETPKTNVNMIRTKVYAFADDIKTSGLTSDRSAPKLSFDEALADLLEHDLHSIKADIASVRAGNGSDVTRVNIHVTNLELNSRLHKELLKKKAKDTGVSLTGLATTLGELDSQPAYHGKLSESVQKLTVIAQ